MTAHQTWLVKRVVNKSARRPPGLVCRESGTQRVRHQGRSSGQNGDEDVEEEVEEVEDEAVWMEKES